VIGLGKIVHAWFSYKA